MHADDHAFDSAHEPCDAGRWAAANERINGRPRTRGPDLARRRSNRGDVARSGYLSAHRHKTEDVIVLRTQPRRPRLVLALLMLLVSAYAMCFRQPMVGGQFPSDSPATTLNLPGRQVWGHLIAHGFPNYVDPNSAPYGELYPLDLESTEQSESSSAARTLERAQSAGLTGLQMLQFEGVNKGSDFVATAMDAADLTWLDDDEGNNFVTAPCLVVRTPAGALQMIQEYVDAVGRHPSASRVAGEPVVFVYAPRQMSTAGWNELSQQLAERGLNVYLIGDMQPEASQHAYALDRSLSTALFPYFDASWVFDDSTNRILPDAIRAAHDREQPFASGIMPGYDRQTSPTGGFVDPNGTANFRDQWEESIRASVPWVVVNTWNDMVERTAVVASSDWNITRQDVNAFYSAELRGRAFPKPRAELYVTTASHTAPGRPVRAEGLVLNGGQSPATVTMRLVDGNGRRLTSDLSTTVAPGTAGAVTLPTDLRLDTLPAGHFAQVEAWTTSESGRPIQQARSAPILVYPSEDSENAEMRPTYYSVPASGHRERAPTLTMANGTATATDPSPTTPHFLEILQNTGQVQLALDSRTLTAPVPMSPRSIVGGEVTAPAPHGFYVARSISTDGQVAYSTPVYVPPGTAP